DRADYAVTPDMTYKITDYPEKVESMNAPKNEPEEVVEKSGPIRNVLDAGRNVLDAGMQKIESLVGGRKNTDYPIRSLLDDEPVNKSDDTAVEAEPEAPAIDYRSDYTVTPDMTYRITDKKPVEEPVPPVEETVDRADYAVTPDMTYKITDYPEKVESMNAPKNEPEEVVEKSGPIRNVLDAGKNVLDAGMQKIESLVGSRKNTDYPIRSLLDDEPVNRSVADFAMDAETEEEPAVDYRSDYTVTPDMTYRITDKKTPAESAPEAKQVVEPAPVEEIREPVVESVYGKGVRKLPLIPIGTTVDGKPVNLNIDGNITYICGNRGDGRKTLTERAISHIIADTHPDDVELWMFDCGDGVFMKYANHPAAHIKYLVSDTGAETTVDFADVVASELERRVEAFAENGWADVGDIPADVFMPLVVVAINAFPRFSENIAGTPKYFGRNYTAKLSKLFKSCENYGIHFLLIGDNFSENGECPQCLDGCTIHSAVVVSGKDPAAHKLFDGIRIYDNEIESLKKIPAGCAFTADENSTGGLTLVRISGENAVNEHTYTDVPEYSEDLEVFLDKHPFIGDRKTASRFDDRRGYREKKINNRVEGEYLLFLGEPCRFMGEYPVRLFDDFGENLLTIAPARERSSAALVVKAALRSLEEQGIKAEVLACRSNPVYAELQHSAELSNINVYDGAKAETRVKEIADKLDNGERSDVFEIVLGGDLLMASMQANDTLAVLKRALVKGPSMGAHFMFVSGSAAQMTAEYLSLFRHKLVFACPYNEAEKILRDPNCDLPENGFRLSNDYDELTILPYSM
ncbi:MAG: hypothetical protein K2J80_07090, partial [Oscillospiraceae bacterium]|nr:hypothetical protein [Oscillospiraceae bacterium]